MTDFGSILSYSVNLRVHKIISYGNKIGNFKHSKYTANGIVAITGNLS